MQAFFPKSPPSLGAQAKTRCEGFHLPLHQGKAPSVVRLLVCEHTHGSQGFCAPPPTEPPGRFCKQCLSALSLSVQHKALFHPLTVFPISLFKYRQLCMGMLLLTMKLVISSVEFPPDPLLPDSWRPGAPTPLDPSDEGPPGHPVLSLRQWSLVLKTTCWVHGSGEVGGSRGQRFTRKRIMDGDCNPISRSIPVLGRFFCQPGEAASKEPGRGHLYSTLLGGPRTQGTFQSLGLFRFFFSVMWDWSVDNKRSLILSALGSLDCMEGQLQRIGKAGLPQTSRFQKPDINARWISVSGQLACFINKEWTPPGGHFTMKVSYILDRVLQSVGHSDA